MKKCLPVLLVIIMLILLSGCLGGQTYSDVPSMEKKIAKELDAEQVSAFDVQDIGVYRFVGYTFDSQYSFAVFKQNDKGDYTFDYVKKPENLVPRAENIGVGYHSIYWIAVSSNESLDTIKFEIDAQSDFNDKIITLEITENPSISVIELPDENYQGEYNFYDGQGNLIK